ncbi:MAG: hypothetical protein HOL58_04390 [Francisellaceae bacterium]|nr:hypothetical protein [Francisellaceae bacterium]
MAYLNQNKVTVDNTLVLPNIACLERARALILYPSMCMPAVITQGQQFIFILLVNEALSVGENNKFKDNTSLMQKRINLQLRYSEFAGDVEFDRSSKFDLLPGIIRIMDVELGMDCYIEVKQDDFCCTIAKDVLMAYFEYGFKKIVVCRQPVDLSPCLKNMAWYEVGDVAGNGAITSGLQQKINITELEKLSLGKKKSICLDNTKDWHPFFVLPNKEINVAHITDLHISSRVVVLKKNMAVKMANNTRPAEKIHDPMDSVRQLMNKLGRNNKVDIIWVTGDIVDFHYNVDVENIDNWEHDSIWETLNINNSTLKERNILYVDVNNFYKLIEKFYRDFGKPVFFTFGNHDSYEMPYGISPRLFQNKIASPGGVKANSTIPMDHNLTFYEAILLFGPGYNKIINKHHLGEYNYKPYLQRYYFFFLTSIVDVKFVVDNQMFVGIDWGKDESILEPVVKMVGMLPRANTMLNENQKKLIITLPQSIKLIQKIQIFTHAPIINYDYGLPLTKDIKMNMDVVDRYSKYDSGSFKNNKMWLLKILLSLKLPVMIYSGHSHRYAIYNIHAQNDCIYVQANGGDEVMVACQLTCVVSASSGPIAVKNIDNEYMGYGLESPSATYCHHGVLHKLYADSENSKPRFCVLVDSIDILSTQGFLHGIYTLDTKSEQLIFAINQELTKIIVNKVELYVFANNEFKLLSRTPLTVHKVGVGKYTIEPLTLFLKNIKNRLFLAVSFKPHDSNYCFIDPWLLKITVEDIYRDSEEPIIPKEKIGYKIIRDYKFGEIPDFKWHSLVTSK